MKTKNEMCPDCGRSKATSGDAWLDVPLLERARLCATGVAPPGYGDDAWIACAELTIANGRARVAELEHQGESTEYALSAALGMTAFYADGSVAETGDWETMIARVATLNSLAYAGTHHEQGQEDADEVCDVCAHAVTERHTFRECIRHIEAVHDGVNGHLSRENERLETRVAEFARYACEQLLTMYWLYPNYRVDTRGPVGLIREVTARLWPELDEVIGNVGFDKAREAFFPTDENGEPVETPPPAPPEVK